MTQENLIVAIIALFIGTFCIGMVMGLDIDQRLRRRASKRRFE